MCSGASRARRATRRGCCARPAPRRPARGRGPARFGRRRCPRRRRTTRRTWVSWVVRRSSWRRTTRRRPSRARGKGVSVSARRKSHQVTPGHDVVPAPTLDGGGRSAPRCLLPAPREDRIAVCDACAERRSHAPSRHALPYSRPLLSLACGCALTTAGAAPDATPDVVAQEDAADATPDVAHACRWGLGAPFSLGGLSAFDAAALVPMGDRTLGAHAASGAAAPRRAAPSCTTSRSRTTRAAPSRGPRRWRASQRGGPIRGSSRAPRWGRAGAWGCCLRGTRAARSSRWGRAGARRCRSARSSPFAASGSSPTTRAGATSPTSSAAPRAWRRSARSTAAVRRRPPSPWPTTPRPSWSPRMFVGDRIAAVRASPDGTVAPGLRLYDGDGGSANTLARPPLRRGAPARGRRAPFARRGCSSPTPSASTPTAASS